MLLLCTVNNQVYNYKMQEDKLLSTSGRNTFLDKV